MMFPLYDFECPKCKKVEEHRISKNEPEKIMCEPCDVEMVRIIGATPFLVKGYNAKNNYGLKGKK